MSRFVIPVCIGIRKKPKARTPADMFRNTLTQFKQLQEQPT